MATSEESDDRRILRPGLYWGNDKDLDGAIRKAVSVIPEEALELRRGSGSEGLLPDSAVFVVTSITVEVVGDPNVGAYSVTVA
jgi:hypothetical protein